MFREQDADLFDACEALIHEENTATGNRGKENKSIVNMTSELSGMVGINS